MAAAIEAERAHFVDEAGTHTSVTREYARATRGERVSKHVPCQRGIVTTMVASLCAPGIEAVCTYSPGDVVVWDGLAAHKDERVGGQIGSAGATVVRLPPYSPDLNPIELAWALVKKYLRSAKVRLSVDLPAEIHQACSRLQPRHGRRFHPSLRLRGSTVTREAVTTDL